MDTVTEEEEEEEEGVAGGDQYLSLHDRGIHDFFTVMCTTDANNRMNHLKKVVFLLDKVKKWYTAYIPIK